MSPLLLVRHGQARFGSADYTNRLSPTGERQARLVGRQLAGAGLAFDALIAGDMTRQKNTAALAAAAGLEAPTLQVDAAFNEYDADALFATYLPQVLDEDETLAAHRDTITGDCRLFQRAFEQITRHWLAGTPHDHPACESWADFKARVHAALVRLHDNYPRDALLDVRRPGTPNPSISSRT